MTQIHETAPDPKIEVIILPNFAALKNAREATGLLPDELGVTVISDPEEAVSAYGKALRDKHDPNKFNISGHLETLEETIRRGGGIAILKAHDQEINPSKLFRAALRQVQESKP